MSIISSITGFINRHKRKFIFTTAVTVSLCFAINQFVIKRFRNFQDVLRQEVFIKEQIKRRYIQTQEDCYLTLLALLPVLSHPIVDHLPIEMITQALKLKKNGSSANSIIGGKGRNEVSDSLLTTDNLELHANSNDSADLAQLLNLSKSELWKSLKVKTITRALSLIYSISGLFLVTKLQLNILARRSYLESAIVLAGGTIDSENSAENYFKEQSYLSLSWWLLNRGWIMMSDIIERAVDDHFKNINARTEITIAKFDEIITSIIQELNSTYKNELLNAIFPINYDALIDTLVNTNSELVKELDVEESVFVKLVNETNFLVNNTVFSELFFTMILNAKSTLTDNLYLSLNPTEFSTETQPFQEVDSGKKFKLANLMAQISVQCGILCDANHLDEYISEGTATGNIYLRNMNELEALDDFSASIYSNFE